MTDEKETKETPKEEGEGEVLNSLLAEAKGLAETIVEGNKKHKELLDRQEQLLAEQVLGGNLGGRIEHIPKVETAKDYAEKVMSGKVKAE